MAAIGVNWKDIWKPVWKPVWRQANAHATSGVLTGAGAALVGSAARIGLYPTSGVLTGAGGLIVGTAALYKAHATSGVLAGTGAIIVGVAARSGGATTHDTTGTLAGAVSLIVGTAARTLPGHPTSGVLTGPGSILIGSAAKGIVYVTKTRSRQVLSVKPQAHVKQVTFDFISQCIPGEYLVTATNAISIYSGADPLSSLALSGSVTLSGTRASQFLTGGVVGCSYLLTCRGVTNYNKKTFLNAFLLVL